MSNYLIGIGGSGAKLMHSLIHLGAAGMLPDNRREMDCLLVDPDTNNGNNQDCYETYKAYVDCRQQLQMGKTELFSSAIQIEAEPWTPLKDATEVTAGATNGHGNSKSDTLKEIFHYTEHAASAGKSGPVEVDLLDTMFEQLELDMSIKQGFRGRPAIGATVLANSMKFNESPWKEYKDRILGRGASGKVHVMLAGSVFGGSGASGVPTLARLFHEDLTKKVTPKMGLVLFLPYFLFRPVANETVQADPAAFALASSEALKYYHERGFLNFCNSIYTLGEETPADMAVSAVGASEQRNEPHFVELIAAMGAMKFFSELKSKDYTISVAARVADGTLTWGDLPYDEYQGSLQIRKLQQLAVFAVAYRYIFFPEMIKALNRVGKAPGYWVDHIERQKVDPKVAGEAVAAVREYVDRFLTWLLRISTPRRQGFVPGLVDPNVFGMAQGQEWRLKDASEFSDSQFGGLLQNVTLKERIDDRAIYRKASGMKVKDAGAVGPGRLIRALYDACAVG